MISFILLFVLLLVLSAVIINGLFAITRGRWETRPDGTKYWTGKIFCFFHKFLQQHTVNQELFKGELFLKELYKVKDFFKNDDIIEILGDVVVLKELNAKQVALFYSYANSKDMKIALNHYVDESRGGLATTLLSIYKEVPKYKIPYLIADPLGLCLCCMSSFYGTLLFIFWYCFLAEIDRLFPTVTVAIFLQLGLVFKLSLWVIFCTGLAYLNDLLFNIKKYFDK